MDNFLKGLGTITFFSIIIIGLGILCAWPTKLIVNYLFSPVVLTTVFGVAKLTFWKAFYLNMLCAFLFKSSSSASSNKKK